MKKVQTDEALRAAEKEAVEAGELCEEELAAVSGGSGGKGILLIDKERKTLAEKMTSPDWADQE